MTVKLLEQKVKTLERRLYKLEQTTEPILSDVERAEQTRQGLLAAAGLWVKKPRTQKDLLRIRKQLWG